MKINRKENVEMEKCCVEPMAKILSNRVVCPLIVILDSDVHPKRIYELLRLSLSERPNRTNADFLFCISFKVTNLNF